MSVLNGFAMLNNAIRGIRTQNQQHDLAMANIEQKKQQMELEYNDPQRKLARIKAARQMEEVPINYSLGQFDNDRDREFFNRYTRPALEGILDDEDMELSDDGRILEKGSTNKASRPRYVAETLANKIGLATQASRLGHTELDFNIDKLEEDLYQLRKNHPTAGHPKEKIMSEQLKIKESKLAELYTERDDPSKQLGRLMKANSRISKMQMAAMTDPNIGGEFYTRLDNIATRNNNEIRNLIASGAGTGKNIKAVKYSNIDDDTGIVTEQEMFFPAYQANTAPEKYIGVDGKVFKRGSVSNLPDGGGAGDGKLPGDVTLKTAQGINDTFNRKKDIVSAAKVAKAGIDRIKDVLKINDPNMTDDELNAMAQWIEDNSEDVLKNWEGNLQNDIAMFGRFQWFQNGKYANNPKKKVAPAQSVELGDDPFGFRKK
jgi:hypothetical protein